MQTVAPERYRTVMGHFATGVTVVTANSTVRSV
jgi:flavin reductase (DIM6/NTAB) family NADH-FMN oxidoreductase RutF